MGLLVDLLFAPTIATITVVLCGSPLLVGLSMRHRKGSPDPYLGYKTLYMYSHGIINSGTHHNWSIGKRTELTDSHSVVDDQLATRRGSPHKGHVRHFVRNCSAVVHFQFQI